MRLPPALAASATPRILELLGAPPVRVVEVGFAGIHAMPLRLAGYDVTVVEPDPAHRKRARERTGGEVLAAAPEVEFDVAVVPDGVPPPSARVVIVVRQDGSVWSSA